MASIGCISTTTHINHVTRITKTNCTCCPNQHTTIEDQWVSTTYTYNKEDLIQYENAELKRRLLSYYPKEFLLKKFKYRKQINNYKKEIRKPHFNQFMWIPK